MQSQLNGTPPYDHPVYKTTSLLRPCSFKANIKNIDSFYYFEDPVNATTSLLRPGFYGPTVVALTGFHCKTVKHGNVGLVSRSFKSMDVIHNEILSFSMRLSVRGPVLPNAHWRSKRSVLWKNNFLTFLEMAYYLIIFYIFIY